ncbi:hypothetical protein HDU98_007442 [Podochytrium sp. JEL0797]|nr:hypothetical protein HDU98_007442 [Podochytrium sp. JEL0797]
MGNATYVNPNFLLTAQEIESAIDSILEIKQAAPTSMLCFQMSWSNSHPPSRTSSHDAWKSALLQRGFELDLTPAKLMKWSASSIDSLLPFQTLPFKVLDSIDDIMLADKESAPYSNDAWWKSLRAAQHSKGPTYGLFMASLDPQTNQPVAIVSIHAIQGSNAIAINWCGTNPAFGRRGHAMNAVSRALEHVVKEYECQEVYLTAVDEGPEIMYQRIGFAIEEDVVEWKFLKPVAF